MKKWILSFLFLPLAALAQRNLVERVYEASSTQTNPVMARQEILNQAVDRVSESLIKEIIGEAKYSRNKVLIQSKIVKNSARYLPFSKPGELQPQEPAGFKMTVVLRASIDELQALLLENGLFYESDSTPIVLPAVRILDKVNSRNFSWWMDADNSQKAFLFKQSRALEENLKSSFLKHNFYLIKPVQFRYAEFLPSPLKTESIRDEDWGLISQRLGAQILVEGEMAISKSQIRTEAFSISLRLTATQVMNSRVIAEVSRLFETDAGPFETVVDRKLKEALELATGDLASQVLDAWQKGALGASLFKLTVRGRLPLLQQEAFKEALKNKVRDVKNIRERLISSDGIVFEVDSVLGPKEMAQKAAEIEVAGLKVVLESANEKEATYRVAR